jgi:hypothetical protein
MALSEKLECLLLLRNLDARVANCTEVYFHLKVTKKYIPRSINYNKKVLQHWPQNENSLFQSPETFFPGISKEFFFLSKI